MALITDLHLDRLSVEDRLVLVEELWDSIGRTQSSVSLSAEQQQELERRLIDHQQHPDDVVSWDEVKATTLARLGQ